MGHFELLPQRKVQFLLWFGCNLLRLQRAGDLAGQYCPDRPARVVDKVAHHRIHTHPASWRRAWSAVLLRDMGDNHTHPGNRRGPEGIWRSGWRHPHHQSSRRVPTASWRSGCRLTGKFLPSRPARVGMELAGKFLPEVCSVGEICFPHRMGGQRLGDNIVPNPPARRWMASRVAHPTKRTLLF